MVVISFKKYFRIREKTSIVYKGFFLSICGYSIYDGVTAEVIEY